MSTKSNQMGIALLLSIVSFFSSANSYSNESPYEIIEQVTKQVFQEISKQRAVEGLTKTQVETIIKQQMLPHIDVTFASYKVLGPMVKKATPDQRRDFVEAMEQNLVKTYSSALAQYNNQKVIYEPAQDVTNQTMVAIRAELIDDARPPVSLVFKMRKNNKTGQWRAYDLVVEGISLIDAKRSELAKPLREQGIDEVTNLLSIQ